MKMATCHTDRPVEARGLCQACYMRAWRLGLLAGFQRHEPNAQDRRAYWRAWKRQKRAGPSQGATMERR